MSTGSTGNVSDNGDWKEYEEQPLNHSKGYFWLRSDGLRMGLRGAGRYYRKGTRPVHQVGDAVYARTGTRGHDNAMAVPLANIVEGQKIEHLPDHIRFVDQDGNELELLTSLDGVPASQITDAEPVFRYADKKWPKIDPKRTFIDATSNKGKQKK